MNIACSQQDRDRRSLVWALLRTFTGESGGVLLCSLSHSLCKAHFVLSLGWTCCVRLVTVWQTVWCVSVSDCVVCQCVTWLTVVAPLSSSVWRRVASTPSEWWLTVPPSPPHSSTGYHGHQRWGNSGHQDKAKWDKFGLLQLVNRREEYRKDCEQKIKKINTMNQTCPTIMKNSHKSPMFNASLSLSLLFFCSNAVS